MLRKQLWYPDTCGCIIEVIWDDEDLNKEHVLNKFLYVCEEHQLLSPVLKDNDKEYYNVVLKENRKKNHVLNHMVENDVLPATAIDTQTSYDSKTQTKNVTKLLHGGINYNYYYTGENPLDRTLVFSLEGLDKNSNVLKLLNTHKASIRAVLESKTVNNIQMVDQLHEDLHPEYKKSLEIRARKKDNNVVDKKEGEEKRILKINKFKDFFTK